MLLALGCLFSDGRKEPDEEPAPTGRAAGTGAPAGGLAAAAALHLRLPGVRRDRTDQFRRMREVSMPPRQASAGGRPGDAADGELEAFSAALADLHERVSVASSSLASKLAQHNGLKQFGADFSDRAPPLELRVLLPELEAAIEQLLDALWTLGTQLRLLAAPGAGARHAELRGALLQRVADVRQEAQATFDAQRSKVRELAVASPLLSPMIAPGLGRRLAGAMSSPQHSYAEPFKGWSPSTVSTMSHVCSSRTSLVTPRRGIYETEVMNELEDFVLDEISEDESELEGAAPPFSSVFAASASCGRASP